jgi:hypothetical protein
MRFVQQSNWTIGIPNGKLTLFQPMHLQLSGSLCCLSFSQRHHLHGRLGWPLFHWIKRANLHNAPTLSYMRIFDWMPIMRIGTIWHHGQAYVVIMIERGASVSLVSDDRTLPTEPCTMLPAVSDKSHFEIILPRSWAQQNLKPSVDAAGLPG